MVKDFNGELAIHFLGLKGLDKPIVWVFPKLKVCLGCGFGEFVIPDEQKEGLRNGIDCTQIARECAGILTMQQGSSPFRICL